MVSPPPPATTSVPWILLTIPPPCGAWLPTLIVLVEEEVPRLKVVKAPVERMLIVLFPPGALMCVVPLSPANVIVPPPLPLFKVVVVDAFVLLMVNRFPLPPNDRFNAARPL